jgi:PAS domain S-box-containing protein
MFQTSASKTLNEQFITSQENLAAATHNYETLLQGVETIKDYAIIVLDKEGRILTWNKGAELINGYPVEEVIGQPSAIFYKSEALEQRAPEDELERAKAQGRFEEEGWQVRKDGTLFWANVVINAIYNERNEHIGFVKIARDLTERKLAEGKVKTLEKGINSVKDYAIFLLDKDGCVSTWNKGAEILSGYPAEEIMGKSSAIFYTPEAAKRQSPDYELESAKAQGRFEEEGWRLRKDGTAFWVDVIITAIYDEGNEPIAFIKVIRDLTERKLAEEKIKTLEKGVDSVKDYAIHLLDKNGYVSSWNKGAELIKGYRADEIIGRSIEIFYTAEDIEQQLPKEGIEIARAKGRFEEEGWRICKDGSKFWAHMVITAIYDEGNEHTGFVEVTRDLTERKLAEEKIKTLEKGVDSVKDYAIYLLDKDGYVSSWNKGAEAINGYRAQEIIGQSITIFYKPEAIKQQLPEYSIRTAKTQGRFEDEGWRIRKDGSTFWADVVITAIYNERNEHIGFVKVTHDSTERKLAEEKIKTLEKGIDSVKDYAIFLLDKNGCISTWNKGAEIISGYREEEIIGQSVAILSQGEVSEQQLPHFELETAKTQGRFEEEGWRIRKDGNSFWADVVISAIYDERNELIGFVKVIRDLTERKLAERTLEKSERNYRTLASIAPVGIFHCTPEGHLTYANDQACRFMGLSLEEALGKGWLNAIYPEDREIVIKEWETSLKAGETFTLEYRFYHREKDKIIWVINQARPELDEASHVKSYVQTITNINKRKMLEEKERERLTALEQIKETQRKMLEEAENNQKRLNEFINTICHEIRNPLNGMVGSTEMLKEMLAQLKSSLKKYDKTLSFEMGKEFTSTLESLIELYQSLKQSVQQQRLIVDNVLDDSKLGHNKLELKTAPFSPKSVVIEAVQIFSAHFKQKGLQLELKLPDKEMMVEGDAGRLKQVLINLLSNALKFTAKGSIGISLTEHYLDENKVELTIQVRDTGEGMDQEEIDQLFKYFTPFDSLSSSSTFSPVRSTGDGTGLGLRISQKIIGMMGGHIAAKTEKGKGTEMSIKVSLPLSTTPHLARVSSPTPMFTLKSSQRRILIVEDNLINQKVLINYIRQMDWDYEVAGNGLEALNCFEETVFDMILMDIEMPVMNGLDATQQIRQREEQLGRPPIIIIGISANAQPQQIETAKEAGMNDYLTKPVHKVTLLNLLHRLMSKSNTAEIRGGPSESSLTASFSKLPSLRMPFFQTPAVVQPDMKRLVLQFKTASQELVAQHFPFSGRCENNTIIIELLTLTPYLSKFVLNQFRQLVKQVFPEQIAKARVSDHYLRLTTHTPEEALTLKTILSEAGFAEAFNKVSMSSTETPPPNLYTYSS